MSYVTVDLSCIEMESPGGVNDLRFYPLLSVPLSIHPSISHSTNIHADPTLSSDLGASHLSSVNNNNSHSGSIASRVSSGYHNSVRDRVTLATEVYFLTVLEAGSARTGGHHGGVPARVLPGCHLLVEHVAERKIKGH